MSTAETNLEIKSGQFETSELIGWLRIGPTEIEIECREKKILIEMRPKLLGNKENIFYDVIKAN